MNTGAVRALGVAQAAVGIGMVLAPARIADAAAGGGLAARSGFAAGEGGAAGTGAAPGGAAAPSAIVRVLGAREVVQGVLTVVRPGRDTLAAGAAVDALHASSMLAVAALFPRWRRSALVSGGLAGASIGASLGLRR